jgi:hypothetical protein
VGWWFSLWIGYCWLCRVILFIGIGGVVVYFVDWILLVVETYIGQRHRCDFVLVCGLDTAGCVEVHYL